MQDLVGIGITDAGDDALIAQQTLDLRASPVEQTAEDLPCEGRLKRIVAEPGDSRDLLRIAHHVHGE